MHDPLHRLYRTKLALLATLLLVAGFGVLITGHWLAQWPVIDIGSGMFTTGLLGVALQYLDGQASEVRDTERLKRVLAESAPAMRDAVISGFAFQPAGRERIEMPEVLDQIATNSQAIRTGDPSFAADLYEDLREHAIGMPGALYHVLTPMHHSTDSGHGPRAVTLWSLPHPLRVATPAGYASDGSSTSRTQTSPRAFVHDRESIGTYARKVIRA